MTTDPIFVVGFQRSGTTLLQSLLGSHSRIAAPPETYFVTRIFEQARYFGDLGDDENLRRAIRATLSVPGDVFDRCDFDEGRLFDRVRRTARSYADLLDGLMSDFAERAGKVRWSEKTPGQQPRALLKLFPNARLVHIVRDPRDCVASALEVPGYPYTARNVATKWRKFVLDAVAEGLRVGPGQFLQVRYEDLVRDPEAVLRLVCTFIGEKFEATMLDDPTSRAHAVIPGAHWMYGVMKPVGERDRADWASRLGQRRRLQIAPVVNDLLPAFGYRPYRRRAVVGGRIANLAWRYEDLPEWWERTRLRLVVRTPEDQFREMERAFQRRVDRWRAADPTTRPVPTG